MEANLPSWVQEVSIAIVACISIIVGVWRYIKADTGPKPSAKAEPATGHVVAASFIDSKLLRELIDALREHQEEHARTALRVTRSQSELREAVLECVEAARLQSDSMTNLVRFLNRSQTFKGE